MAQYRRWEWFWQQRVTPDGQFPDPMVVYNETARYKADQLRRLKQYGESALSPMNAQWKQLGPIGPAAGTGAGRVNRVHVNPDRPSVIWIGTAAGGAWLSKDNGDTWTPKTDGIPSIGISDIATSFTDPNLVYIATGDADGVLGVAAHSYSVGVMRSNDGGTTWTTTGLNWQTSNARVISRLLLSPVKPEVLLAATNTGIYRTEDAGNKWTLVQSGNFNDMEFKPGTPTTLYASAGGRIYRSQDEGKTWQALSANIQGSIYRIALAVTPANPEMVYALCTFGSDGTGGFGGFYSSSNSGTTWTLKASGYPNILGSSADGQDNTQQGWYDLCIAASPTNAQEVYVGGVSIWKTTNGGSSWSINASGYGAPGKPYIHPDIHDLVISEENSSVIYAGCDGGFYTSIDNGKSWDDMSAGLGIMQFYGITSPPDDPNTVIGGSQDNGTNRWKNGGWSLVLGGDGMRCLIDPSNPNTAYASQYNGSFYRSTDGGNSFRFFVSPRTVGLPNDARGNAAAAWVAPIALDPVVSTTVYVGFADVWKYTASTKNWTKISSFGGGAADYLSYITVSHDGKYIYAGSQNGAYVSKDAGATWETLMNIPGKGNISDFIVHPSDPKRVWISISGYSSSKVFTSNDAGTSWVSISDGLPAIPVNCLVYQTNSPDRLYAGTEAGVYYRDNGTVQWIPYNDGLPNVIIGDLEINEASGKLRAATFGRGLWEGALVTCVSKSVSVAVKGTVSFCEGDSTILTASPGFVAYKWSNGATTPSITVKNSGNYSVLVTDENGCPSASPTTTVTVNIPKIAVIKGSRNGLPDSLACPGVPLTLDGGFIAAGYSIRWSTGDTTKKITVSTPGQYTLTLISTAGCIGVSQPFTVLPDSIPAKPKITSDGVLFDTLIAPTAPKYQWYLDGVEVAGATTQKYIPPQTANGKKATVAVFNAGGCFTVSDPVVIGTNGVEEEIATQNVRLFPNPTGNWSTLELTLPRIAPVTVDITASNGTNVQTLEFMPGTLTMQEKISFKEFPAGAYILTIKCGTKTWMRKIVKE